MSQYSDNSPEPSLASYASWCNWIEILLSRWQKSLNCCWLFYGGFGEANTGVVSVEQAEEMGDPIVHRKPIGYHMRRYLDKRELDVAIRESLARKYEEL